MSEKLSIQSIPEDIIENLKYSFAKAKEDHPRYLAWIKNEVEVAIDLIERFDKIYVLGGFGARLLKSIKTPASYFFQNNWEKYSEEEKLHLQEEITNPDDDIEVLLEYVMSIASATPNANKNILPLQKDIEKIYQQLLKIKFNFNFYELTAEVSTDNDESDSWLRTSIISESLGIRGSAYQVHIEEVYRELFQHHNEFLQQFYGFNADDVYDIVLKLDKLVYSKIGNTLGLKLAHERFKEWLDETKEETSKKNYKTSEKHFMQQFTEANPDFYDENAPIGFVVHRLDHIESYNKIFWVIPKSETEKLIFEKLSIEFGDNKIFYEPQAFKGFPMNDTLVKTKPLIKDGDKYFHFSSSLAYRNIFKITEELIKSADITYYEKYFRGNSSNSSKDNYIEIKTKQLFEKLLPNTDFYHSLKYKVLENKQTKKTELDILGVSSDTIYIIEVKSGELNPKLRRGALKGLKDRIGETIGAGTYQCHRAFRYISENANPIFTYNEHGVGKTLTIDKSAIKSYFKISVTFEQFWAISTNLKYLISSSILSSDFKWAWIISLYDLMIFADIIQNETDFKEYLKNRINLYDREDIEFLDEIDILGFYLGGNFPLKQEGKNEIIQIINFKKHIEKYYTERLIGISEAVKPQKRK